MNKIVVLENGQQLISKVSVISREDNGERIGYLLEEPKVIAYYEENGDINVRLIPFSPASINTSFEVRLDSVLSFGDPHPTLSENYENVISENQPQDSEVELELESAEEVDSTETEEEWKM